MPTLHWIGKEHVVNHHQNVPVKILTHRFGVGGSGKMDEFTGSGSKIIHGDNLEALKALLPEYEGRIDCIYIDPPYNTGNESWVYNDNVSDPKLRKWLHHVVGKEGDDLNRHDKWLCMMYPRLMLLYKLLSPAGVIFISIDDNEFNYLSLLLEEIFGKKNMVETMIWKKSYGGGSKSKHIVNLHEYIFFCAKNIDLLPPLSLPPDESLLKYYKFTDEKLEQRGPYRLQTLATTSMDERPNLRYAIPYEGEEIWPAKQWQWSKDRALEALANNELVIEKKKKKWSVNYKQYLKSTEGEGRGKKLYSIIDGIYTQQGTSELKQIFPDSSFTFPKPVGLIRTLLTLVTNKNSIILDSFAGSGTTAQAVLNLNKADGGERKFILIETEDYAESITAERVKRVIRGNDSMPGTGGAFDYFVLGERVFDEEGDLNAKIPLEMLKRYIWYTETNTAYIPPKKEFHESFLGKKDGVAYFFNFKHEEETILDRKFLKQMNVAADEFVVYAGKCFLPDETLLLNNITFKKIPRDIIKY